MGLVSQLTFWATNLVADLGYGGIALGLILNSAGVPIPSEIILPLTGALIRQGKFQLFPAVLIAWIAQVIGAAIAYWIGATGGPSAVKKFGKYVFFREAELVKTQGWYERYGVSLTLFGYLIPGIRSYTAYPAGLSKLNFNRFLAATAAGTGLWTIGMLAVGYWLFAQIDLINGWLHRFGLVMLILLVAMVVWYLTRIRSRKGAK